MAESHKSQLAPSCMDPLGVNAFAVGGMNSNSVLNRRSISSGDNCSNRWTSFSKARCKRFKLMFFSWIGSTFLKRHVDDGLLAVLQANQEVDVLGIALAVGRPLLSFLFLWTSSAQCPT